MARSPVVGAVREEVRVVREVLESALSNDVASRVMFEALAGRAMPKDSQDVLVLVREPLAVRLTAQVGRETAAMLVAELDAMLVRHQTTGSYHDVEVDVDDLTSTEPSVTKAMALSFQAPVPVLIAAASDQLALLLEVSLGPSSIRVQLAPDEATLRRLTFTDAPLIALLDGEDPPRAEAAGIAAALASMPESIVRVVWAADAPAAHAITRLLDRRGAYVLHVARSDGIDPLLDLVRSRRKTPSVPPERTG